jgi:hypothetical protein
MHRRGVANCPPPHGQNAPVREGKSPARIRPPIRPGKRPRKWPSIHANVADGSRLVALGSDRTDRGKSKNRTEAQLP